MHLHWHHWRWQDAQLKVQQSPKRNSVPIWTQRSACTHVKCETMRQMASLDFKSQGIDHTSCIQHVALHIALYRITVRVYCFNTVLPCYCIAAWLYYCLIAVFLYCCITVFRITVLVCSCIAVILYYRITVQVYCCNTVLPYCCITVWLTALLFYWCIPALLYYCIPYYRVTVVLQYIITVSVGGPR